MTSPTDSTHPCGVDRLRQELLLVLHDAANRARPLLTEARRLEAQAARRKEELAQFLEQLAFEANLFTTQTHQAELDGTVIDLDAMREDIVALTRDAAATSVVAGTIASTMHHQEAVIRHLESDQWASATVDAMDLRIQEATAAAREEERRRLSREIHDGPAQVLTNAVYAVQLAQKTAMHSPETLQDEFARVLQLLRGGVAEVRRFMFDLRPSTLEDEGIVKTLRRTIDDYSRFFGRAVHVDIADELPTLTPEQELTMFRVTTEALQNVHKHAGSRAEVWISLGEEPGLVCLAIRDNGQGFDPDLTLPRYYSGAGLPGMRERADLAGGNLTVSSEIGVGTNVRLTIPVDGETRRLGSPPPRSSSGPSSSALGFKAGR